MFIVLQKIKKFLFATAIATLCSFTYGHSQWLDDKVSEAHIHEGIDLVYNLSFDSARTEFQQVVQLQPDHPAGYFFLAMVEWWRIVIDIDDESYDEKFISMLDKVIDVCDKRLEKNEKDLSALFFKGGALGFRGRLYANREDWIKAANDGRTALPVVHQAYKLAPDNYDVLLGMGIYNYYAEVIPEQYPIVKPLMIFFPNGDKQKGIIQLREASEHATYANVEATYFLLQLFYNYEKQHADALPLAVRLYKRFPNNPLFEKYVGRCYTGLGQWEEMHNIFLDIQRHVDEKKLGFTRATEREAQFYLGLYDMNFKKYDDALQHFYRCDELSRMVDKDGPSGFMTMTNLKIGMIYDMQSKRNIALKQYNKVLKMTDYQDAHKQAERYLKIPYGNF